MSEGPRPDAAPRPPRRALAGKTAARLAPELFSAHLFRRRGEMGGAAGPEAAGDGAGAEHAERIVEGFNRKHRLLFASARREIGSGVWNFILSCLRSSGKELMDLLSEVPLRSDGHWDGASLVSCITRVGLSKGSKLLDGLLRAEAAGLYAFLDSQSALDLERELEAKR